MARLTLGPDELPIQATTISDHVRVVMKVGDRGVLGSIMVLESGLSAGAVQTVGNVGLFLRSMLSEKEDNEGVEGKKQTESCDSVSCEKWLVDYSFGCHCDEYTNYSTPSSAIHWTLPPKPLVTDGYKPASDQPSFTKRSLHQ